MTRFVLNFDEKVIDLEKKLQWDDAIDFLYQRWKQNPFDLNNLLCAGTESWYVLEVFSYPVNYSYEDGRKLSDPERIADYLTEVTRWGFQHFADNAVFNAYFGYMMQCIPYIFLDFKGDYDGWQKKGENMMRLGYQQEPDNPFAKAMAYEFTDDYSQYRNACRELWSAVTPEEWGDSEVQQYFFYILYGDLFYKNAYGRTTD